MDWDKTFTQNGPGTGLEPAGSPGWTGGDSTYSLLLPNGDSAFFFSDSYIGEATTLKGDGTVTTRADGARTTAINCFPPLCDPAASTFVARNSIVIRSKDGKPLRTLVGARNKDGFSTSYFKDPTADLIYWMGDQIILPNKRIAVFLLKFDSKLGYHGSSIAQLDPKSLAVEKIVDVDLPDNEISWGASFLLDSANVLYIYGKGAVSGKKLPYVAKVDPTGGVDAISNAKDWKVWNGGEWLADIKKASPLVDPSDSISDEFDVRKFKVNGVTTYVLVAMDTTVPYPFWKDITLYSSCTPTGIFTGKHKVYTTPETAAKTLPGERGPIALSGTLVVYNPHIHTQFSGAGRLLVSYNLNRNHNSDSIFIDGYRPRFIWVPVAGLK